MATTKEISGSKKRTYQKATINLIEMAGKTTLLSSSGFGIRSPVTVLVIIFRPNDLAV